MKVDGMIGTCSAHGGDQKYVKNYSWQTCKVGTKRVILTWLVG